MLATVRMQVCAVSLPRPRPAGHHLTELHRSLQLRGLPAGICAQCTGAWTSSRGSPLDEGGKWEHIKEKTHLQKLHPIMGH